MARNFGYQNFTGLATKKERAALIITTARSFCKWARQGSNPRPIGYEPTALTSWATGPNDEIYEVFGAALDGFGSQSVAKTGKINRRSFWNNVIPLVTKGIMVGSGGYEPVALTVKLTALIMMKKCCWWLNRQLIAKAEILAMKFSKNCGTSSYLKVDAVGSAGYEPRVLTAELMALMKQPKQAVANRP